MSDLKKKKLECMFDKIFLKSLLDCFSVCFPNSPYLEERVYQGLPLLKRSGVKDTGVDIC